MAPSFADLVAGRCPPDGSDPAPSPGFAGSSPRASSSSRQNPFHGVSFDLPQHAADPPPSSSETVRCVDAGPSPNHLVVQEAPALVIPVIQEAIDDEERLSERALVCRFNGLWPKLVDLHPWTSSAWSLKEEALICPCARGFFIVIFGSAEDRDQIFRSGPWFWGRSGLSIQP